METDRQPPRHAASAPHWTPRQQEVLDLLARGATNFEIAQALGVSLDGAKWHVREILSKLGVESREDAAAYWRTWKRPLPRLRRHVRGLFAAPAWRWLAATAAGAVAAGLAAILMLLAALPGHGPQTASVVEHSDEAIPAGAAVPASPVAPVPLPAAGGLGMVAFLRNGDIWVKPLPAGPETRVTTDGGNFSPKWSPSGRWLAFARDGSPWVLDASTGTARPVDGAGVDRPFTWAPNEDLLAFVSPDDAVEVLDPSAARTRVLGGPWGAAVGARRLAWSPDGTAIGLDVAGSDPSRPPSSALWVLDAGTGEAVEVYATHGFEPGQPWLARWTARGESLVFWQGTTLSASIAAGGVGLYSVPAQGGQPSLVEPIVLAYDDFVAVSPTGAIAVVSGGGRVAWAGKSLVVAGSGVPVEPAGQVASSPAWSPDGKSIAFVAMPPADPSVWGGDAARDALMGRRLWLVAPGESGGAAPRQLTADPRYRDEYPLWSPDGETLLFARFDRDGNASLWLLPLAGGPPEKVVDGLWADAPCCSHPPSGWFGFYGHVRLYDYFDWWRPPR